MRPRARDSRQLSGKDLPAAVPDNCLGNPRQLSGNGPFRPDNCLETPLVWEFPDNCLENGSFLADSRQLSGRAATIPDNCLESAKIVWKKPDMRFTV